MDIVIDIPMTDEEIKNEFEEQTEDFRRRGLLPTGNEDEEVKKMTKVYLEDLMDEFDALLKMQTDPDRSRFHRYSDPNAVIDENKSVKWNREEVQRRNAEYRAEKARLFSLYVKADENCIESAKKYIMGELRIDHDRASVVWDRVCSEHHSCGYREMLNSLEEEIDYLRQILR